MGEGSERFRGEILGRDFEGDSDGERFRRSLFE
jgi:hypothetical protein